MSDSYNYVEETLTAEAIQNRINQLATTIDDFSYEIETEDVNALQRQIKAMQKKASHIVVHFHPYDSFGYVLPDGTFYPSPFGTHEEAAIELLKEHGWKNEKLHSSYTLCRDFLVYEKGYVLIHNPLFDGGYVVSRSADKMLTKAQKETLYDYFMENGDTFLANKYFNEDYDETSSLER